MNQKIKHYGLLSSIGLLIMLYFLDYSFVKESIINHKRFITDINNQLLLGSEVIEEMNQTRKLFSDNLDRLLSYKISNSGLQLEIKQLGALAKKNGINISNMKIDDDTFPNINHNVRNDIIKLERQIVSFELSGTFLNIGRFIESIKESESNLQMQYCSFNLDSLDPRGVIAQMEYSTYGGSDS